jgi:hypothetical protein
MAEDVKTLARIVQEEVMRHAGGAISPDSLELVLLVI